MKKYFYLYTALIFYSSNVYAGFDWGNTDGQCSGSGQFGQSLQKNAIAYIGEIPKGKKGVTIRLSSSKDLDIQLYDKESGKEIVAWPNGILNDKSKSNTSYESMEIEWSGYKGDCPSFNYGSEDYSICAVNTSPGNEYISIDETKRDLVMKAYAFRSGGASVQYNWSGTVNCTEGGAKKGEGTFKQFIQDWGGDAEKVVTVGKIPKGLTDIYIGLTSKNDVDIRLYDKDGTLVIHWPNGLLKDYNKQILNDYKGVKIEYSGYNGDGKNKGHEYIKIRGTTKNEFVMKAFGYNAGVASVDYSWGKFTIFSGISGGDASQGDLWDGGDGITSWADSSKIMEKITKLGKNCSGCMPNNNESLEGIANYNSTGGLVAIAYNVANTVLSRSSFNTSGNTDVLRADIETYYNDNNNAKVFIAGHSTGGGDTQNLIWKLKTLGIPVELSGHIDSVEVLSADSKISDNVKRAMGFYQNDGAWATRGEDSLIAEDSSKTTATNTKISKPKGPADPSTDSNAYHRNMDNDKRVWGTLLDYIKSKR